MSLPLTSNQSPDSPPVANATSSNSRTLLLAPPSIASHEERLRDVFAHHDRSSTDLQMLDRLSAGLVSLPRSTYDVIIVLDDVPDTRSELPPPFGRDFFEKVFQALKPGARLKAQNRTIALDKKSTQFTEAILAGLIPDNGHLLKPQYSVTDTLPLRSLGKRVGLNNPNSQIGQTSLGNTLGNSRQETENDDDELIDEDTILTEEEKKRPLNIPAECAPRVGKRRRACKDCTCGLAERLAAEDAAKWSAADAQLRTFKLGGDELSEVDFTIKGKIGSCGNCSLGDAFRCEGCPYIGMPAFKPGEEVRLLNNEVNL